MVTFTEAAQEKIAELIRAKDEGKLALRVKIVGRGPAGFLYSMQLLPADETQPGDLELKMDSFTAFIDAESAPKLEGATVDYMEDKFRSGFHVENPNPLWEEPTAQAIQEVLDARINPGIAAHGGFVSLVEYKDDVAYIAFGGGCQGCGMIDVTLKQGVEVMIKEAVPQVRDIVDLTDHASGERPFYQSSSEGSSAVAK
jgi:Fe/S biogenesis protein NfuA